MATLRLERDVAASSETVWAIITDLDRTSQVVGSIKSIDRLDDGPSFAVGTRWDETRQMFGRESTETMEVTAIDEGRSYTVEADTRGAHYVAVMGVESRADGSLLFMTFDAEPQTLGSRIMSLVSKLFEGSVRKGMAKDLDDIAAAAESTGADVA